jgi:hypothetical protein
MLTTQPQGRAQWVIERSKQKTFLLRVATMSLEEPSTSWMTVWVYTLPWEDRLNVCASDRSISVFSEKYFPIAQYITKNFVSEVPVLSNCFILKNFCRALLEKMFFEQKQSYYLSFTSKKCYPDSATDILDRKEGGKSCTFQFKNPGREVDLYH